MPHHDNSPGHGSMNFRIIGDLFKQPQSHAANNRPAEQEGRYNRPNESVGLTRPENVDYMITYSDR